MVSLPIPTPRQLAWHDMEYYAFVHFGLNTYTGKEWGEGLEDPNIFNPKKLDCRQWVKVFKAAGMKGVIITAKHHDGFCLWPSQYSKHTVAQSAWKSGKGDVLKELSTACKAEGLKFGVYVSPWDRNHPTYGTDAYNGTFAHMLTEVLSHYGPIFEVWFDGANGEGPNGKKQVYDWDTFHNIVRKLQPKAVMFSDSGPDIRWVGNENGIAGDPCWATINRDRYFPGTSLYKELTTGDPQGKDWVPAECDVSIRPGWFWREAENAKVKSPDTLFDLYMKSVGRGANFLLNVPANADGLISPEDISSLMGLRAKLDAAFGHPLRGRWNSQTATLDLETAQPVRYLVIQEDIRTGQHIRGLEVEISEDGTWKPKLAIESVGHKRILDLGGETMKAIRIRITKSEGTAKLAKVQAF